MATSIREQSSLQDCGVGHVAVSIDDKVYRWGGVGSRQRNNDSVDVFDVRKEQWQCLTTRGSPPLGVVDCAYTAVGATLCTFGGNGDDGYTSNSIHQLNTETMEWREMVPRNPADAPQTKAGSGMISLDDDKLVVFAGYTEYNKLTDELHVFDFKDLTWSFQPTTGANPPPLGWFTFTKIDATRAVVFGGFDGSTSYSDTYMLDLKKWHWTLLDISKGSSPSGRASHTTCCLSGSFTIGIKHPVIVVIGGWGQHPTVFSDVWLLAVDQGMWKQMSLPEAIHPRLGHTATMFGSGPGSRELVLWGGRDTIGGAPIGKTTLIDLELNEGEWEVSSVVKEDQMGEPDQRLQAKIGRLWPQQTQTLTEAAEKIACLEEKLRKAEEQAKECEEKIREAEEQAKTTEGLEPHLIKTEEKSNSLSQFVSPASNVPQKGDKPKFRHLKLGFRGKDGTTVRVIKTIATKWDELAYALDFAREVVTTIRRDNPQSSESACEEVLDRWLSGDLTTRQPVTWATLIESLRDCQQNSLAEDLDRALI